jgi:prepilin-type N-terminal cleavage/methylation domain-containing protein
MNFELKYFKLISNFKFQILNSRRGFTLIELIVTIAIISVLSAIILFVTSQYINKGKDSNVLGNLSVLITAGEDFYKTNRYSYSGFCESSVVKNIKDKDNGQMPKNPSANCPGNDVGLCCKDSDQSWAACVKEFTNSAKAFCVDSRGVKREICISSCTDNIIVCPDATQCN